MLAIIDSEKYRRACELRYEAEKNGDHRLYREAADLFSSIDCETAAESCNRLADLYERAKGEQDRL